MASERNIALGDRGHIGHVSSIRIGVCLRDYDLRRRGRLGAIEEGGTSLELLEPDEFRLKAQEDIVDAAATVLGDDELRHSDK